MTLVTPPPPPPPPDWRRRWDGGGGWGGGKGGFCFFVEAVMKGFLLSVGGVGDVSILSRLPSSPDGTFSFKILWDSLRFFEITGGFFRILVDFRGFWEILGNLGGDSLRFF